MFFFFGHGFSLLVFPCRNKPGREHDLTKEELQIIVNSQDPSVREAWYDGIRQLRDPLVLGLAKKGPLPRCIVEALEGTPCAG